MRSSFWSRLLAGWFACWLPLVLADGGWLHACPMHDGVGLPPSVATSAAPVTSAAMPHHMPHAMSHMAPAGGGRASHDSQHRGHHAAGHVCTCLGACCAVLAVLPVRPAPVAFAAAERAASAPTGRPQHEYVAAWVDFVLPFATAPPPHPRA